jgi:hypothetical protein
LETKVIYRRFNMKLSSKQSFTFYTLVFLVAGLSIVSIFEARVWAERDLKFTNASIQGDYASFGIGLGGMSPNASAGMLSFDGEGVVTGTEFLNQPGPSFPERRYDVLPVEGTYEVDPRGTGVVLEKGTDKLLFRFQIAKATVINDIKIAREITLLPLDLVDETGNLILSVATKLPGRGEFSLATLKGTYAFRGSGQGGQAPESGIGIVRFDGEGNASAFDILNLPGASSDEREILRFTFEATYVVDENGFGTITPISGPGEAFLVIRKAEIINGVKVAREFSIIINNLSNFGNLVTDDFVRTGSDDIQETANEEE